MTNVWRCYPPLLALACTTQPSAPTPVPPACAICHMSHGDAGTAMPDDCARCHEPARFHVVLGVTPDPSVDEWWYLHWVDGGQR